MSLNSVYKIVPHSKILPTKVSLTAYGGSNLNVVGKIVVNCKPISNKIEESKAVFIVVNDNVRSVLGLEK